MSGDSPQAARLALSSREALALVRQLGVMVVSAKGRGPTLVEAIAGEPIKVRPGSKTEAFLKAAQVPVHVPLSGKTMEFDAAGKCTSGC